MSTASRQPSGLRPPVGSAPMWTFAEPSALLLEIARFTHRASAYREAIGAGLTPSP